MIWNGKKVKRSLPAQFKDLHVPSSPYICEVTRERSQSLFSLARLSIGSKREMTQVPPKSKKTSLSSQSSTSTSISSGSTSNTSASDNPTRRDFESTQYHEISQSLSTRSATDRIQRSRLLTPQSPTEKGETYFPQVQDNEIEEEESRDQVSSQLHLPHIPKSPSASKPTSRHTPPTTVTNLSIKAVYGDCIISLRLPPSLPFVDVRHRIYTKLVGQEGVTISPSYTMAAGSLAVTSQGDWDKLLHSNSKITLRITNANQ